MNGKIQYQLVCKNCGKIFTGNNGTIKYCSPTCANRADKADKRQKRLREKSEEVQEQNRQNLLSQEYLSISAAAQLLGISRPTLYNLINQGSLPVLHLSKRTARIKRTDLEKLNQQQSSSIAPITTPVTEINKTKEVHITASEAIKQFNISVTWFYRQIKKHDIKSITVDGKVLYPLKSINRIFTKKQFPEIAEWYTVDDIIEKFNVSKQYIYEYTSDHKIPKKKDGKFCLISKYHWDKSRGLDPTESKVYYTVPEATEKFEIGRGHLYDLIRVYKIPKIKHGKSILINRQELDNLMNKRKQ